MDITIIKEVIAPYLDNFRNAEGYFEDDDRCLRYFRHNPINVDAQEILLKISAMDHTEIDDIVRNRQIVADHIASLQIDDALQQGSPEIVNKIAQIDYGGKTTNLYAFATRFCNWHNIEVYPIYDKTMEKILELFMENINNQKPSREDIFHYPTFKEMMMDMQTSLDLMDYNFKELDKFIWISGKQILQDLTEKR